MKLLFCLDCEDVKKLDTDWVFCNCGKTAARYLEDKLHSEYRGATAIPVGFDNYSFAQAVRQRRDHGSNWRFEAFTIPADADTVKTRKGPMPRRTT